MTNTLHRFGAPETLQDDYIVFEAGTHADAIKMSYADYARLATPMVASFAVKLR